MYKLQGSLPPWCPTPFNDRSALEYDVTNNQSSRKLDENNIYFLQAFYVFICHMAYLFTLHSLYEMDVEINIESTCVVTIDLYCLYSSAGYFKCIRKFVE